MKKFNQNKRMHKIYEYISVSKLCSEQLQKIKLKFHVLKGVSNIRINNSNTKRKIVIKEKKLLIQFITFFIRVFLRYYFLKICFRYILFVSKTME